MHVWESSSEKQGCNFIFENILESTKNGKTSSQVHQLVKDLGVISRLDAKSSLNILWAIKAKKVFSESWNLSFVTVSGQLFGWKPQPEVKKEMHNVVINLIRKLTN